jgi:hypothetical protein
VVLRQNSQTRIIVSVDFIQRSASIDGRNTCRVCRK